MNGIEGLYSALGAIIGRREENMHLAISVEDIVREVKSEVDPYSASLDWYVKFALESAARIALYQKGYRSVIKGNGIFVNPEGCDNPNYLARLFNNAKYTEEQKRQAVNMLRRAIKNSGIEGQLSFDADGSIYEDVTEEQLLQMLKRDAGIEEKEA